MWVQETTALIKVADLRMERESSRDGSSAAAGSDHKRPTSGRITPKDVGIDMNFVQRPEQVLARNTTVQEAKRAEAEAARRVVVRLPTARRGGWQSPLTPLFFANRLLARRWTS